MSWARAAGRAIRATWVILLGLVALTGLLHTLQAYLPYDGPLEAVLVLTGLVWGFVAIWSAVRALVESLWAPWPISWMIPKEDVERLEVETDG